jgi:DNA-binding NarL/FixJ family response regulator
MTLKLLDRAHDAAQPSHHGGSEGAVGRVDQTMPTPAVTASQPAGSAPKALRVLVVDDTASIRTEIRFLLEEAGLSVVGEASHGAEGVTLAKELKPEVVVMDLRMPILDGIAATSYITRELPQTRVIVFSAFDDDGLEDAARAAGASGFLVKGATPAAIADAVRDAASA